MRIEDTGGELHLDDVMPLDGIMPDDAGCDLLKPGWIVLGKSNGYAYSIHATRAEALRWMLRTGQARKFIAVPE